MKERERLRWCACAGCSADEPGLCLGLLQAGRFRIECDQCGHRDATYSKNLAHERAQLHANATSHVVEIKRPHAPFLSPVFVAPKEL